MSHIKPIRRKKWGCESKLQRRLAARVVFVPRARLRVIILWRGAALLQVAACGTCPNCYYYCA